jgi:hypothetical protein
MADRTFLKFEVVIEIDSKTAEVTNLEYHDMKVISLS